MDIFFMANFKDTDVSSQSLINMKVISKMVNIMVKVSIPGVLAMFTKGHIKMAKNTATECIPALTDLSTREIGRMAKEMEKVLRYRQPELYRKYSSNWVSKSQANRDIG
jgi:hypothetical protein